MAELSSALYAIPPVTRSLLLATGVVTVPTLLGLLSPYHVALLWSRVIRLQLWRLATAFFYGGSGFPLLYDVFLIYRNSSSLEADHRGDTAAYAWMHLMLALFIHVLNIPFGFPFLFRPLLHAQNYTWCRANPTMKISIFGLITIPASLYPFALIALDLITGGPGKALGGVMGLLSGHLWWFLNVYLPIHAPPRHRRPNALGTPAYFRSLFASQSPTRPTNWPASTTGYSVSTPRAAVQETDSLRHRWGSGNRLGGESL